MDGFMGLEMCKSVGVGCGRCVKVWELVVGDV